MPQIILPTPIQHMKKPIDMETIHPPDRYQAYRIRWENDYRAATALPADGN